MFSQLKQAAQKFLVNKMLTQVATRQSDPNFFGAMQMLPNPDPILRKLGIRDDTFDSIRSDAHVIGELRSIRAGLLSFEWRIVAGGEKPDDLAALELAKKLFTRAPAKGMRWPDVIWNVGTHVLTGYTVHEVVWERFDRYLLPATVLDRPNRRFVFGIENELRLRTREAMLNGVETDAYKFLLTRHMPTFDNPYGVALYSSCFWPYTFKHGGFKFFYKFCEKYGLPWAIGKYPIGTPKDQQDALADALQAMVEDAVAAIPGDGSVELLTSNVSGQIVQERMIDVCNREMSKALTSQTLSTEIQGNGSRAAAETHRGKEETVQESDREVTADTFNQLLQWITEINFPPGTAAPTFEFFDEAEARKDWLEVLAGARAFMDVPVAFAHERLQIPQAKDGEAVLPRAAAPAFPTAPGSNAFARFDFAAAPADDDPTPVTAQTERLAGDAGAAWRPLIESIRARLDDVIARGDDLAVFRDELLAQYGHLPSEELTQVMTFAFAAADLAGRFDVQEGQ